MVSFNQQVSHVKHRLFSVILVLGVGFVLNGCGKINIDEEAAKTDSSKTPISGVPKITADAPNAVSANQCVPIIMSIEDSEGRAVLAPFDMSLQLAGISLSEVYRDGSCSLNQSFPMNWGSGVASKVLYIKPTITQVYNLQFEELASKAIGSIVSLSVTGGTSSEELKLVVSGPSSFQAGLCKAYVVSLQSLGGVNKTRSSSTSINLAGNGSGSFYAGSNCSGGAVSSVSLLASTSMITFSFKDTSAENLVLTADAAISGVSSGFVSVEVTNSTALMASQLSVTGASSATASACSAPVQVRSLDSAGNSAAVAADLSFTISGNLGFQAYADASCLTPLLAPKILSGSSSMSFYYMVAGPGSLSITADDSGAMTDAALSVTVTSGMGGSASKLAVTGPSNLTVGVCSSAFLVKTQDGSNLDYPVTSLTTVNLTGKGSGDFYSDGTCSSTISSLSFASGDHTKSFYYKTNAVGALVFNADDPGPLVPGSASVNIAAGSASQLALTGPTSINLGDCRAFVVTSKDSNGFTTAVSSSAAIDLSGGGAGVFFTDSSCSISTTSVTINSGQNNAVFYYKSMSSGSETFAADDLGPMSLANLGVTIAALPAVRVAMTKPVLKSGQCHSISAMLKDSLGGAVLAGSPVTVNLAEVGSGVWYSDSGCGSNVTSAIVSAGQSSVTVYYKDITAEAVTLSMSSAGLSSDSYDTSVGPSTATQLILSGATSIGAGACIPLNVEVRDAQGNLSPVTSSLLVTMTGASSGRFSTLGDCSSASSTFTITTGANQGVIYFMDNSAETVTLQAAASGVSAGTLGVTINAGGAVKTKWTLASSATAGQCQVGSLQVQDSLNNPVVQGSARTINLTDLGNASFYSTGDCSGGSVTSLNVAMGQSLVSFSMKDDVSESLLMTASSSGLSNVTQSFVSQAGAPSKITLSGPAAVLAAECRAYDLRIEDTLGNLSNVASNQTINFSGVGSASFYSDAGCSVGITSTIFTAGTSLKVVYLKGLSAASLSIQADDSGSLTAASKSVQIQSLPAVSLAMTGPTSSVVQSCATFLVKVVDAYGNSVDQGSDLTVDLLGKGSGGFYSDAGCSALVNQVTVSTGTNSKNFYFKSNVSESLSFLSQASGLADASKSFSSVALAPSKLVLSGLASISTGTCSGYTASIQDSLNNAVGAGVSKTINLSGAGAGGAFYLDSACSSSTSSISLTSSQTDKIFYYKTSSAGSPTLVIDDIGLPDLTAANLVLTVTSSGGGGGPTKLAFAGSSNINTGTCAAYVIQSQDSYGSTQAVSSDTTITLAGVSTGSFYSDTTCSTTTTAATLTNGTSLTTVYFKDASVESLVLQASASGFASALHTVNVNAASGGGAGPAKLALAGATSVNLNTCAAYSVIVNDSSNTPSNVSSDLTVNLSGASMGGFYSDAGCSTSVSTLTITTGTNNKPFYFRTGSSGSFLFMAQATGLALDTKSVTVDPPSGGGSSSGGGNYVPIKLLVTGPAEVLSSTCGGQFTVSIADSTDQVIPVSSPETVTLTNGAGNGTFYSDASCGTSITSLTFSAGTSQKTFYFKDDQAESVSLQAYSANLIYGSLAVQVKPSGRLNLSMTTSASAVWQNFIYRNRGTLSDRTVVLQNVGLTQANSVALDVSSLTGGIFDFRGGSFPGLGGTCQNNSVLLPNQQCTMVIRFQPNAQSSFSDNIRVNYDVGVSSLQVNLPLTGTANTNLNPMAISAGHDHTCVTLTDMSTKCYGLNNKGQLGVGNNQNYGVSNQDIEGLSWTPFAHFATQVVGGAEHSCALMPDGKVICWGDNAYGQLGSGTSVASIGATTSDLASASYTFVNLGTGMTATKISAGAYHTCALLQNGTTKCWGFNQYGQLGQGDSVNRGTAGGDMGDNLSVIDFGVGQTVVDLASGAYHNCVVLKGGQLKCWGRNVFGQLGIGSTADMGDNANEMGVNLSPVSAASGATILSVGAGVDHTCAILTIPTAQDPIVKCWGRNDYGQLGIGDALQRGTSPSQMGDSLPLVDLGLSGVPKKLALGRVHSCVLLATGSVKCWGGNGYGQTGLSEATTSHRGDGASEMGNNLPTLSLGSSVLATDIAAGLDHTCVLIDTNKARCWGRNNNGQLGHNHAGANVTPWGASGNTMASLPDSHVNNYSYYEGIALDHKYTCGVDRSQMNVTCWGNETQSGLRRSSKFHDFSSKGGVKQLEAGTTFMCALTNDASNSVFCWGNDAWFTQRIGQTTFSYANPNLGSPTMTGISSLAAGENFLCTLSTTNVIKCFGWNIAGSVGAAGAGTYIVAGSAVTMTLPSGTPAALYAGASHACVVNDSGDLYCWGANNFGQLGDNSTTNRTTPTSISVGGSVSKVSMGRHHTCVVLSTGQVKCWGDNQYGQLGDGTTTQRLVPTAITLNGGGNAKDLSLGEDSSCAVMADDKLQCWGRNSKGELALGTTANANSPQVTNLGQDFRIFMAKAPKRGQHRCAIGWENARQVPFQLKCWGDNSAGQLGYFDTQDRGEASARVGRAILPVPQNLSGAQSSIASVPESMTRATAYTTPSGTAVVIPSLSSMLGPTGVAGIRVKMWGGGGGAGNNYSGGYNGGHGGAGGYIDLSIPSAQITGAISIWVGGGGSASTWDSGTSGGGGGSSALKIGSTLFAVASGGGGGGYSYSGYHGGYGGAGGPSGQNGYHQNCSGNMGGYGASPTTSASSGSYGSGGYTGEYGWLTPSNGKDPGANGNGGEWTTSDGNVGGVGYGQGGRGLATAYFAGGGGGAGYYGGGAGAGQWSGWCGYYFGAGGGGGSNYIHPSATSNANPTGSGRNPQGTGDSDYGGGAAVGGNGNYTGTSEARPGANGRVVIKFY